MRAYLAARAAIGDRELLIYADEMPEDPRAWDNVGTIVTGRQGRLSLGDRQVPDLGDFLLDLAEEVDPTYANAIDLIGRMIDSESEGFAEARGALARQSLERCCVMLELCWTGRKLFAGDEGADDPSSVDGYIYVPMDRVREEFRGDRDQALGYLRCEVETYSQYLEGDVYRFELYRRPAGASDDDEGELEDSCGGFYGSDWAKNGILDYVGSENSDLVEAL